MRNKERIDTFTWEFAEIWKRSFPDLRFGQLFMNFFGWLQSKKEKDPFFPEKPDMIEYFREYANESSLWYREN